MNLKMLHWTYRNGATTRQIKTPVFWDVAPWHWASSSQCFERLQCLHVWGHVIHKAGIHLGLPDPEDESNTILRNLRNYLLSATPNSCTGQAPAEQEVHKMTEY